MIDPRICPSCGERAAPLATGPLRIACRTCGAERPWRRQPLFCLTGPSGVGKSTVAALVADRLAEHALTLEQDVLWQPELAHRPGGVARFRSTWLTLAAMLGRYGRPVLLCGTVVPAELESLPERALFTRIEYLALLTDPAQLGERLRRRPAWRGWDPHRIAEMVAFAGELPTIAASSVPAMATLDTTALTPDAVADAVAAWVDRHMANTTSKFLR